MSKAVKNDLEVVVLAWRKYRSTRITDAVYPFLQQVYETGLKWKRANSVSEKCRLALKLIEDPPPMYAEAFAVLLVCAGVCTGPNDAKARSRWSRVLRVAEAHKAKSIGTFVKRSGGLNEVAAMYKQLGK
jgi:hypothetical protein